MLTPKQEKFCLTYLETGNATEAYRQAYEAKNMKSETINKRAIELVKNGAIAGRLEELRTPMVEKAQVTFEDHLRHLGELKELAVAEKQFSAAIRAEELRGKAAGLYKDRTEHTIQYETHEQRIARLIGGGNG